MSEHQTTPFEISAVSRLGFKINLNGQQSAEEYINIHFKGFNLLQFVEEIEKHLKNIA